MTRRVVAALAVWGALAGASPAAAVPPQELLGHLTNALNDRGLEVGPVPEALPADAVPDFPADAAAIALPGAVAWGTDAWPAFVRLAGGYGTRGRLGPDGAEALRIALHELAHQRGVRGGWHDDRGDILVGGRTLRWWEEGLAEAVAHDLLAPVSRALFGDARPQAGLAYAGRVRAVRQISVYATYPGRWHDREATAWRARLAAADYTHRALMLQAAHSSKEAHQ